MKNIKLLKRGAYIPHYGYVEIAKAGIFECHYYLDGHSVKFLSAKPEPSPAVKRELYRAIQAWIYENKGTLDSPKEDKR